MWVSETGGQEDRPYGKEVIEGRYEGPKLLPRPVGIGVSAVEISRINFSCEKVRRRTVITTVHCSIYK